MDNAKIKLEHRSGTETHMILPDEVSMLFFSFIFFFNNNHFRYIVIDNINLIQGALEPFFALVKAMAEMKKVALARRVFNDGNTPTLKILCPQLNDNDPVVCITHEKLNNKKIKII